MLFGVGCANCPHYARIELLADQLQENLPNFEVQKIVKLPEQWEVSSQSHSNKSDAISTGFGLLS